MYVYIICVYILYINRRAQSLRTAFLFEYVGCFCLRDNVVFFIRFVYLRCAQVSHGVGDQKIH